MLQLCILPERPGRASLRSHEKSRFAASCRSKGLLGLSLLKPVRPEVCTRGWDMGVCEGMDIAAFQFQCSPKRRIETRDVSRCRNETSLQAVTACHFSVSLTQHSKAFHGVLSIESILKARPWIASCKACEESPGVANVVQTGRLLKMLYPQQPFSL